MTKARPTGGRVGRQSAGRRPLDLSNPPSVSEQRAAHQGVQALKSKSRVSRSGPRATKAPARSPRAPRRKAQTALSSKVRLGLVLIASVLLAWLLPVLGQAGDGVVPTALFFYLFGAFAMMVAIALGQRPAWVIPGVLAVLGLIWAGGLAPELLQLPIEPQAMAFWPKAPQAEGAMALWRIVALVFAALGTGMAALNLAPPRPPLKARSRLKRR